MLILGAPGSLDLGPTPDPPAKPSPAQMRENLRESRREAIRQAAARLLAAGEPPSINRQQLAADLGIRRETISLLYPSDGELITDILAEFTHGLVMAICAAFDAAGSLGALARLEAVLRAWLDHLAAHPDQHRAFLDVLKRLEEPHRRAITSRYQSAVDTLGEALFPAIPGLNAVPPALLATATTLLNGSWALSQEQGLEGRGRTARRIAAVLVTIGTAEAGGEWPGFGPAVGVGPYGQRAIPCREARTRFHELLDYVAAGGEVVLSRRGKVVAKIVRTV